MDTDLDAEIVAGYEREYDEILRGAKKEYEDKPPSEYYKESELLFLHDKTVPANNSLAERLARVYKRKQKQMIVVRSRENFEDICTSLSLIHTMRQQSDENLFARIANIFARKRLPKVVHATQSRC